MVNPAKVTPGPGEPNFALTAVIANAASVSGTVNIGPGMVLAAIVMPAAWTAAALTFQVSYDGVTFQNVQNEAGEYSVAAAATGTGGTTIMVDRTKWDSVRAVKFRSGTAVTPVAQGAQRTLGLVVLASKS